MQTLIDLTHTFDDAMPVYPGDPAAKLEQIAHIESDGYNDYQVCCGIHVGTHMDAPLHMIENGAFMCDIPVKKFFGRGRLVDARGRSAVTADLLEGLDLQPGDIVVVLTGWYHKFRDPDYYGDYREIDPDFARRLVEAKVSMVALDTPSPDRPPFPVHKILLGNDVLIVENLANVEALLDIDAFKIVAPAVRFKCEGAPVRVVARVK